MKRNEMKRIINSKTTNINIISNSWIQMIMQRCDNNYGGNEFTISEFIWKCWKSLLSAANKEAILHLHWFASVRRNGIFIFFNTFKFDYDHQQKFHNNLNRMWDAMQCDGRCHCFERVIWSPMLPIPVWNS